jgi:predicted dehydrogenase
MIASGNFDALRSTLLPEQQEKSMTSHVPGTGDRRNFLKQSGGLLAAGTAALAGTLPGAYAGEDSTIHLALIGCGNRGNGAVANALNTSPQGPIKLYAAADLSEHQIDRSLHALGEKYADKIDVPPERRFLGFQAYKEAIDALRPGDIAMCTTRAYIRPIHVEYAVQRGVHVFMEKPFACDPAGLQRMLRAGEEAERKGVKISAGLQCRHSPARAALIERIRNGDLGELSYVRANRLTSRRWMGDMGEKANDLIEQLQFGKISLLWVGSGHMVDNLIHQIDECCWLMDDWPVSCHAMGGREVGSTDRSQNVDIYSMEYTFPDGRKAFCGFRRALRGHQEFATFVHGSERAAQFSGNVHAATVHMFKDHRISKDNIVWSPTPDAQSPWDYEWVNFIDSIRNDKPHNEAKRAVYADFASLMGRAAAHTNQIVTWDEVVNSEFQFCDDLEELDYDSPPPVTADENGYFPAPHAGLWKEL